MTDQDNTQELTSQSVENLLDLDHKTPASPKIQGAQCSEWCLIPTARLHGISRTLSLARHDQNDLEHDVLKHLREAEKVGDDTLAEMRSTRLAAIRDRKKLNGQARYLIDTVIGVNGAADPLETAHANVMRILMAERSSPEKTDWTVLEKKIMEALQKGLGVNDGPAPVHARAPDVTTACPECGSKDARIYAGTLRQCKECGQDWHTDLDYEKRGTKKVSIEVVEADRPEDEKAHEASLYAENGGSCTCSAADPCPMGKKGMAFLCKANELRDALTEANRKIEIIKHAGHLIEELSEVEWEEDEPTDREMLGEDWGAYISELEGFANYYTKQAKEIMNDPETYQPHRRGLVMTLDEKDQWETYAEAMIATGEKREDRDFEGLALALAGLLYKIPAVLDEILPKERDGLRAPDTRPVDTGPEGAQQDPQEPPKTVGIRPRPTDCREALKAAGAPYPRSSCFQCGTLLRTGWKCPWGPVTKSEDDPWAGCTCPPDERPATCQHKYALRECCDAWIVSKTQQAPTEADMSDDPDTKKGLYRKYKVERVDGSSAPGGKHEKDEYYVLCWDTDPFALPAMEAYALACANRYPDLAKDIMTKVRFFKDRHAYSTPKGKTEHPELPGLIMATKIVRSLLDQATQPAAKDALSGALTCIGVRRDTLRGKD